MNEESKIRLYFDLQPIFIIKTLPSALDAYHGKKNSQIFNSRAVLESNKPKQTKQTTYLPKKPNKTKQNKRIHHYRLCSNPTSLIALACILFNETGL